MEQRKYFFVFFLSSICLMPAFSFAQFNQVWSQTNDPAGADAKAYTVVSDASGIFVGGYDNIPGNIQWRIEKRSLSTGALDATFGGGTGVITSNPSGCSDVVYGIAANGSGIYAIGNDCGIWRIEKRDLTNGALITSFGSPNGWVTSVNGIPYAITLDASGIYVAGYDNTLGNDQWRIEKRDLTTGALDGTFGGGTGVVTNNPSSNSDVIRAITADASEIFVAGYDANTSPTNDAQWRIEKRNLTTGVLDGAFGTGGVVTNNPSATLDDKAYAITADASGIFVAGYDLSLGGIDEQWRIEKRDLSNGSLIAGFGTGGVATSNPTGAWDRSFAITVNTSGIYLAGFDYGGASTDQWRIEQRNLTTGALSCSQTINPSAGIDYAQGITDDATGIYVVGFDNFPGNNQWRIMKYDGCGLPTPVELLYFSVKWKDETNNAALIEWATASETNNDYFEIQRSINAVDFTSIIQMPGAGNSSSLISYSQIDSAPVTGVASYYRLKQVDFNGDFSYSNIVVLNAPEGIDIINIWPNPSVNNFSFMITSTNAEKINIELINTNGKKVISLVQTIAEGVSIISVDTQNLVTGYYLIRAMTESGNYKDQMQLIVKHND